MFKCLLLLLWFIGMHFVYLYSIISVLGFAVSYLVSLPLCLSSAAPSTATSGVSRRRQCKQYHRCLSVLHGLHVVLVFSLVIFVFLYWFCPYFSVHRLHYSSSSIYGSSVRLQDIPIPPASVCQCFDNNFSLLFSQLHPTLNYYLSLRRVASTGHLKISLLLLLSGNVELNPGPVVISSDVNFGCLNIRSASSITSALDKPYLLQEFIADSSIELLALTETWFQPDTPTNVINSILPPKYCIINAPRAQGRGGGIAVIYRSYLKVVKLPLPSYTSFESLFVALTVGSSTCKVIVIYRPPSSSMTTFLDEFSSLLTDIVSSPCEILISGDFNIHVDDTSAPYTSSFLSLLDSFGLTQHIDRPTHEGNHTLDLLISRQESRLISNFSIIDPILSDHFALVASLSVSVPKPTHQTTRTVRSLKSINITQFRNDILQSDLYSAVPTSLSDYFQLFKSTLCSLLDKHAPTKTVSCSNKVRKAFIHHSGHY